MQLQTSKLSWPVHTVNYTHLLHPLCMHASPQRAQQQQCCGRKYFTYFKGRHVSYITLKAQGDAAVHQRSFRLVGALVTGLRALVRAGDGDGTVVELLGLHSSYHARRFWGTGVGLHKFFVFRYWGG